MESPFEFFMIEKYSSDSQAWETAEMYHSKCEADALYDFKLLTSHGETDFAIFKITLFPDGGYEKSLIQSTLED